MARKKTYRCWFTDGTARLVSSTNCRAAGKEANRLALIDNALMPRGNPVHRLLYLEACRVERVEEEGDGATETN